jgi:hypothetical protein
MRLVALLFLLLASLTSPAQAQRFQADSSLSVVSTIIANNTTAIPITTSPATFYNIEGYNNGATIAWAKLYNGINVTCGTGTPRARYMIPVAAAFGSTFPQNTNGDAYPLGITLCVTTGIADSDTTAPAATTYVVNVHFKNNPN